MLQWGKVKKKTKVDEKVKRQKPMKEQSKIGALKEKKTLKIYCKGRYKTDTWKWRDFNWEFEKYKRDWWYTCFYYLGNTPWLFKN
jgi:hypothetical protein